MKAKSLIFLCLINLCCFVSSHAQKAKAKQEKVYHTAEPMPEFPGGEDSLMRYLEKQIKYPDEAIRDKQEGVVQQAFIIDAEGNVKIPPRGPAMPGSIDAEVLRVLKAMPKWKPGQKSGVPVFVSFVLPVQFQLPTGDPGSKPVIEVKKPFGYTEQIPRFPGGEEAMMRFIEKTMKYPKEAWKARKQGISVVSFTVNADGSLSDLKVLKSLGYGMDEEAVRIIQAMPLWEPGKQNEAPVNVKYTMPIRFSL